MGAVEEAEVYTGLGFGDEVPLSLPALTDRARNPKVNDGEGLLLRTFFFSAGVRIAWPLVEMLGQDETK